MHWMRRNFIRWRSKRTHDWVQKPAGKGHGRRSRRPTETGKQRSASTSSEKVSDKETVNERVKQENVQTEEQEDIQTAKIDIEMDNEEDVKVQQDVLYGNAEGDDEEIDGENTEKTRSSSQYEKRHYTKSEEGEAGGEGQQKKQKIANLNQEVRYLSNVYNLNGAKTN